MRITSIRDYFWYYYDSIFYKKIVIVKFITLFCDQERLFESLLIF